MRHEESPDVLRPDAGVSRLNRRPLAIIVLTLAVIVFAFTYGILSRSKRARSPARATAAKHVVQPSASAAAALAKDAPKSGPIPERPPQRFRAGPKAGLILPTAEPKRPSEAERAENEVDSEQRRRLAVRRQQMMETALTAVTRVATLEDLSSRAGKSETRSTGSDLGAGALLPFGAPNTPLRSPSSLLGGTEDVNQQGTKREFAEQRRPVGYLNAMREAPLSPYELKAGTVIPAVLISGVNSDLPGQILAQVTQNVYDSATGNFLLIPQGAKLVGIYDSRVSVGQSRVHVAWTRLNFPDSSTLDLGNMPGADEAGYSGFHDRVNNHVLRIFRDAFMLSLISAGAQLSQPPSRAGDRQVSAEQQIAAAMGQQFGAAGMELAKRNTQVQPTLETRPGYQFAVLVNKDVVLPPYASR